MHGPEFPDVKRSRLLSREPLYESDQNPELVYRFYPQFRGTEGETQRFTEELLRLENYGIYFPGLSVTKARIQDGNDNRMRHGGVWKLLATKRVYGKKLDEFDQLPEDWARRAIEGIVNYYQDIASNGGDYVTDLHPGQIIYGHTAKDQEKRLYFIDMDPLVEEAYIKTKSGHFLMKHVAISPNLLQGYIDQMEQAYGHDFSDLRLSVDNLVATQQ